MTILLVKSKKIMIFDLLKNKAYLFLKYLFHIKLSGVSYHQDNQNDDVTVFKYKEVVFFCCIS